MTVIYLLGFIIVCLCAFFLFRKMGTRFYHEKGIANLKRHIESLIVIRDDEGFIIIEEKASGKFLQFKKKKSGTEEFIICEIPNATWSADFYPDIIKNLRASHFKVTETKAKIPGEVKGFAKLELKNNEDEIFNLIEVVFSIMGVKTDSRFKIEYGGRIKSIEEIKMIHAERTSKR